jgi:SAM-dependent methyltransferase
MEILNPQLAADLAAGRAVKLNLGAGPTRVPGHYGVDHLPLPTTDLLANLNDPLTLLPPNSVDAVITRHTLEHVENFLGLMTELHRIVRPAGKINIIVPHFSNPLAYSDPTHVRFFGLYTFYYFVDPAQQRRRKVPHFYTPVRFRVKRLRIAFDRETAIGKVTGRVKDALVNAADWMQAWYERRWTWIMPAAEVHCTLSPVKEG